MENIGWFIKGVFFSICSSELFQTIESFLAFLVWVVPCHKLKSSRVPMPWGAQPKHGGHQLAGSESCSLRWWRGETELTLATFSQDSMRKGRKRFFYVQNYAWRDESNCQLNFIEFCRGECKLSQRILPD